MIPTISYNEFKSVVQNDIYYEDIDYATEYEKRIACDLSGCSMDKLGSRIPIIEYAYRYNSNILRKTFDRDFVAIMSFMFPTWNNKEWQSEFEPVRYIQVDKRDQKWCICGHWIKHCCIWKNKKTGTSVLVGNVCIKKISETAYRDMLSCVKKQKERRDAFLDKQRDELVAKVEREYDEQMFMRKHFNQLQVRLSMLESHLQFLMDVFRQCTECKRLSIPKEEPSYKTKCFTCYKK